MNLYWTSNRIWYIFYIYIYIYTIGGILKRKESIVTPGHTWVFWNVRRNHGQHDRGEGWFGDIKKKKIGVKKKEARIEHNTRPHLGVWMCRRNHGHDTGEDWFGYIYIELYILLFFIEVEKKTRDSETRSYQGVWMCGGNHGQHDTGASIGLEISEEIKKRTVTPQEP